MWRQVNCRKSKIKQNRIEWAKERNCNGGKKYVVDKRERLEEGKRSVVT